MRLLAASMRAERRGRSPAELGGAKGSSTGTPARGVFEEPVPPYLLNADGSARPLL